MKRYRRLLLAIPTVLVLIAIDQWTKHIATLQLKDQADDILINGVLQLHYLENIGAAFSMLEGKTLFFLIATPLLCLLIAYCYIRLMRANRFAPIRITLLFLFAGAIGNWIDRIAHGYVVDFIYVSLIDFPVFNVADIYVTCSLIALILLVLFYYKDADFEELLQILRRKK